MKKPKIIWNGNEYILVGESDGAIATIDQYENFKLPEAHLFPDEFIRKLGSVIGKKEDIKFTGEFYEDTDENQTKEN